MKRFFLPLLVVSFLLSSRPGEAQEDFYQSIASKKFERRCGFPQERIRPPRLPRGPVFSFDGKSAFRPQDKLDTFQEVKAALADLRARYEPFLRNLAPRGEAVRRRLGIRRMQFRMETGRDRSDFGHTLKGGGKWKWVDIPYYHGPQGPATAWYRSEVDLPGEMLRADRLVLHFKGADYYCDAYINGHHVGHHEGMLDPFEFEVKPYCRPGKNVLLVRLRNDYSMLGSEDWVRRWGNKIAASNSPGWDDPMEGWNCCPAGFGLYQDLYFETRSFVSIADVFPRPLVERGAVEVRTELDLPDGNRAGTFQLRLSVFGRNFRGVVVKDLPRTVRVVGGRCLYKTRIPIPGEKLRLWTPEEPWLYLARVELLDPSTGKILDSMERQFGMRSFVISTTSRPKGRMYLNGKEIRLRGANTMGFLQRDVMAHDWDRLVDDLLLAKLTHMNFIRTTQRSLQAEVYDYADRVGMMMQSDLPLFAYLNQKQFSQALRQAGRMERLLRSHPSVALITFMNESMAGEKPHAISRAEYEHFFDAAEIVVRHENPDRAVKYVDGDYQGPNKGLPDDHCYNIWYHNHACDLGWLHQGGWVKVKKGWMYGCGEFGAEGLDTVDLMLRRYPDQWLPEDRNPENDWTPALIRTAHKDSQTGRFYWKWFEGRRKMADWVRLSREHQAWGVRMVAEAFRRMSRMNTFAVHLFIDAWPNGWLKTLVDTERRPKPAWYVYRDALTPLSVQLRTDRFAFFSGETWKFEVWICNDTHSKPECELRFQVEMGGKILSSGRAPAVLPSISEGSRFQGYIPAQAPVTRKRATFTVRLALFEKSTGRLLHETSRVLDLYPAPAAEGGGKALHVLGKVTPAVEDLARAFDLQPVTEGRITPGSLAVVTDYGAYDAHRAELDRAVQGGGRCLVLASLPEGKNGPARIGPFPVRSDGKREGYWFLARSPGHPALAGTKYTDFKFWYSRRANAPVQHRFVPFRAEGFRPVLTSRGRPVVAEAADGEGRWILWRADLSGRLINPACRVLLEKLLF